jgi:lysine biosynthesis protein LysW
VLQETWGRALLGPSIALGSPAAGAILARVPGSIVQAPIRTEARSVSCPKCGGVNTLPARVMIGELFACPACRRTLEVASLEPLALEGFHNVENDEEDLEGFEANA